MHHKTNTKYVICMLCCSRVQKHHEVIGMGLILNLLKFNILSLQRRKLISNIESVLLRAPSW